jgi:hypothetical protein
MRMVIVAVVGAVAITTATPVVTAAVAQGIKCSTLPSLAECVACGEKRYGHDAQVRHCQREWKSGQVTRRVVPGDRERSIQLMNDQQKKKSN